MRDGERRRRVRGARCQECGDVHGLSLGRRMLAAAFGLGHSGLVRLKHRGIAFSREITANPHLDPACMQMSRRPSTCFLSVGRDSRSAVLSWRALPGPAHTPSHENFPTKREKKENQPPPNSPPPPPQKQTPPQWSNQVSPPILLPRAEFAS